MKITICGSVKFADELVNIYNQLKKLGHSPQMHEEMFGIVGNNTDDFQNSIETKRKSNLIKIWYKLIMNSDAILVCNYNKNGIKDYIGGNTLMEIGFAYVNNKKIFLLNGIPENVSYRDEIEAMDSICLHGDLTKI